MKEDLKLRGIITLKKIKDGKVIEETTIQNTITDVGKADVAGLIGDVGGIVAYKWLAIGEGSAEATATNTTLDNEITAPSGLERSEGTASRMLTNTANDTLQLVRTFVNNDPAVITIQEAGIFNTSTQDTANVLGRQTFGGKTLEQDVELMLTYRIIVA